MLIILFQSCTEGTEKSNTDTTAELIENTETGLTTAVRIEGDSTWSIEERMKHYGIPGVSVAVINNGKIVWAKGYGIMDRESRAPVTSQTLFQASALSIPVSAYAALRMVEQGKVSLDENINSYLQSWQLPDNEFTKEKKATIRNLLNHSAGINLHATPGYSTDSVIPTLIEVLDGTPPAKNEPLAVNKEPDESYYISYPGYGIIQQMMIDVEEREFPEIMNDLVLQPLGMTNSTFNPSLSQEQITRAATAYLADGNMVKGKRFVNPVLASGGLWTTPSDLAKFIVHLQQTLKGKGDRVLSKEMTELMVTPHSISSYGPGSEYGLGIQIFKRKDETYLRHWGWNRGFYAEMIAHRHKEHGVVVMTNSTFPEFNAEVIRAVAGAYKWRNYVPVHSRVEVEQSLVDQITGRYQADETQVEVFQENNLIFIKSIQQERTEELIPISDNTFVRRNASRLIQFKPATDNEGIKLFYLDRNDESIISTLAKVDGGNNESGN